MKKIVVLVGTFFPYGVAISSRMLNFCRLFRDAGYYVHVIAMRSVDRTILPGKTYSIDDIHYQIVTRKSPSSIESFVGSEEFITACDRYLSENEVEFVFMTSLTAMYKRIRRIILAHKVKYYIEQCEWLDVSAYKFGYLDFRMFRTSQLRKQGFYHPNGVVSISRLLDNYYKSKSVRSIRIPTILDIQNIECPEWKNKDNKIHIVFAGTLGTKEQMAPIICALANDEYFQKNIQFDIYGPNKDMVLKNMGKDALFLNKAGNSVVIHGRIPQEQVPSVYTQSDYLIFVRPSRRSSNAGFPTKLAESMSVGTPVITNDTGDIGLYLKNGSNGFVLPENTVKAVTECFTSILSLDSNMYMQIRKEARKTAEQYFDYRSYTDTLIDFCRS